MKRTLTESGEWRDGAATPRLLREELRKLPAELVATDVDDPDKAHDLDAPHVISGIVKDFAKAQEPPKDDTAEKVAKKLWAPGPGEHAPVRQWFVDVAKMRVLATRVRQFVAQYERGRDPDISPCHLWFPVNNVNEYYIRPGNPPPRSQRPRHIKDIDLIVDVMSPPRSIVAELAKRGIDLDIQRMMREIDDGRRLVTLA